MEKRYWEDLFIPEISQEILLNLPAEDFQRRGIHDKKLWATLLFRDFGIVDNIDPEKRYKYLDVYNNPEKYVEGLRYLTFVWEHYQGRLVSKREVRSDFSQYFEGDEYSLQLRDKMMLTQKTDGLLIDERLVEMEMVCQDVSFSKGNLDGITISDFLKLYRVFVIRQGPRKIRSIKFVNRPDGTKLEVYLC